MSILPISKNPPIEVKQIRISYKYKTVIGRWFCGNHLCIVAVTDSRLFKEEQSADSVLTHGHYFIQELLNLYTEMTET